MRLVLFALALLLAAPAEAQASRPIAASETGRFLLVTGAGIAGSTLMLAMSRATDKVTLGVLSPGGAALGAYVAAEAVGMEGTLVHATQGALLGAGLAVLLAVSTDDRTRQFVYVATLPALGAAINLRVGGPILYRTPTGTLAPGWSLRVGL